MEYRQVGRTGIKVSNVTLGSLFWSAERRDVYERLIARAVEAGINAIDTADIYGKGLSESIIGDALSKQGGRDRLVVSTKTFVHMDDEDPNAGGANRRHIIRSCEDSLRRLKTDYIDIYYIHRPSTQTPIDETLRALDDLIRSGKVRYIGTSSYPAWKVVESLWASDVLGLSRFSAEQTPYTLLDRRPERELLPTAESYGIGVTIWSPLVGGFLAGKYPRGEAPPAGSRYAGTTWGEGWTHPYLVDRAFDMVDVVKGIARRQDKSPAQVALAWTLLRPVVASAVIGPSSMEQLEDSLDIEGVDFSEEERARIDELCPPGFVLKPFYLDDQLADFRPNGYAWRG